jgi:hypothetical protein
MRIPTNTGRLNVSQPNVQYLPGTPQAQAELRHIRAALSYYTLPLYSHHGRILHRYHGESFEDRFIMDDFGNAYKLTDYQYHYYVQEFILSGYTPI